MALARKTLGLRKNHKEEQRRSDIKKAAVNAFSTRGYDQTTMDDLVLEAGVSKSAFYWYWPSKADLLMELIDTCMVPYVELIRSHVESQEPFPEKISGLAAAYLDMSRENEKLNRLVHFSSLHTGKKGKDDFGARVNGYYDQVLEHLAALFDQGAGQGFLKKSLDTKALALALLSFVEGGIYMNILAPRLSLDDVFRQLVLGFAGFAGREKA